MQGVVKWFNSKTNTGFISAEDGNEYFITRNSFQERSNNLYCGDSVDFILVGSGRLGDFMVKDKSLTLLKGSQLREKIMNTVQEV